MKVAFAQAGLGAGGAEKVINLIAHHRHCHGDEVHVLAHSACPAGSYYPYDPAIALHTMTADEMTGSPAMANLKQTRWLRREIQRIRPDVLVSFLMKTNVKCLAATSLTDVPVIVSERNNPNLQVASRFWQPAFHALAARAAAIVMQTEAALLTLPKRIQAEAVVIPNPCMALDVPPKTLQGGSRVVAVGRLDEQKGFDLLIEAFAMALSAVPALTLTIFGEGPERPRLEKLIAEHGIAANVSLPGNTSAPQGWVESADIFVLSSRFEGFSNVLVEAMAAGIPSIAFDCPWSPAEIISDQRYGRLVPEKDIGQMARAIEALATDAALYQELAINGPTAVAMLAPSRIMTRWDQVIDTAARQRRHVSHRSAVGRYSRNDARP
ncbi:MAG: glycosyltransferase [Alphaproteobacteria bacterium]|nr:glycosyltransferase [Alphaproteobacteria bacterium]